MKIRLAFFVTSIALLCIAGAVFAFYYLRPSPRPHDKSVETAAQNPVTTTAATPSTTAPAATPSALYVPVLMYHYIRSVDHPEQDRLGYGLSVTPTDFESQMYYLANNGFTTLIPSDLVAALDGHTALPDKSIMLTFDDGYQDFYTAAFPILKKLGLKATLFVITGFIGDASGRYVTWDEISEMERSGLVTIGAHTATHPDLSKSPRAQEEIESSQAAVEAHLGHAADAFAYPLGRYASSTPELVRQAGFDLAFTTHQGNLVKRANLYLLPRLRISGGMSLDAFIRRVRWGEEAREDF